MVSKEGVLQDFFQGAPLPNIGLLKIIFSRISNCSEGVILIIYFQGSTVSPNFDIFLRINNDFKWIRVLRILVKIKSRFKP